MTVKQYEENDLQAMITIWNDVVEDGQIVGLYITPSQQCRQMRPSVQCKLCCGCMEEGAAYRRKTGKGLSCTGKKNRISGAAV